MILERIASLLHSCDSDNSVLPPTQLFNESWLLRLVIDWFARNSKTTPHPFAPLDSATWFAEAWLPSSFLPRYRKDALAESWTHADGAVGHFGTGSRGWSDLVVLPDAKQLTVIEGKMFSRLSGGVKNAPWFDQAARTVACTAELLRRADRHPMEMEKLAFCLVAPRRRIEDNIFAEELTRASVIRKVRRRVEEYAGARDDWFRDWFVPTIRRIEILSLSWEEVIESIAFHDYTTGQELDTFYGKCQHYNRPQSVTMWFELRSRPTKLNEPDLTEPTAESAQHDPIRSAAIRRKG